MTKRIFFLAIVAVFWTTLACGTVLAQDIDVAPTSVAELMSGPLPPLISATTPATAMLPHLSYVVIPAKVPANETALWASFGVQQHTATDASADTMAIEALPIEETIIAAINPQTNPMTDQRRIIKRDKTLISFADLPMMVPTAVQSFAPRLWRSSVINSMIFA